MPDPRVAPYNAGVTTIGTPWRRTTMLTDGVAQKVPDGALDDGAVEVLDIAELLQRGLLPAVPAAAAGEVEEEAAE